MLWLCWPPPGKLLPVLEPLNRVSVVRESARGGIPLHFHVFEERLDTPIFLITVWSLRWHEKTNAAKKNAALALFPLRACLQNGFRYKIARDFRRWTRRNERRY